MPTSSHIIIAYYFLNKMDHPQEAVKQHKNFVKDRDIRSRIYISEEGVNAQMSATTEDGNEYLRWIQEELGWEGITFKIDPYHEHAFPKKTVKYRKELVALSRPVDMGNRGISLKPEEWKEKLDEKDPSTLLLDVRNDYEWKVGHFENAVLPPCSTFRDFERYADQLSETVDPKATPVMMYCTGGIRCEIYSSLLKEKGFDTVYQLDGGVIQYGKDVGNKHWNGKLFVFDDRLTVSISEEEAPICGVCASCSTSTENYYNCANMDCNDLFLSCESCLQEKLGCCSDECQHAERKRPFHDQDPHKPFRKWYHYFDEKKTTA